MTDSPAAPPSSRRRPLAQRAGWATVLTLLLAATPLLLPTSAVAQRAFETDGEVARENKKLATARRYMIAAANPHATDAGLAILRAGGSAVDAAIAAQLVLNLVEPQSSGIGGGAFLMHWSAGAKRLVTYDGRETAPSGIAPEIFLGPEGQPRGFWDAVTSGESVGAPGVVRMMELAHKQHGRLPWAALFAPAIKLADAGFPISRRLNTLLASRGPDRFDAKARGYFFDASGKPHPVGSRLTNPTLAATLRQIASKGADAFYTGAIAAEIVAAVKAAPHRAGKLSAADLAGYTATERAAVCTQYRGSRVCGMGPPSSGGLATAMTLQLLMPFDLGAEPMNASAMHLIVEAQKLAYADRDRWIADPDKVAVPAGLLDAAYLKSRGALIDAGRVLAKAQAGTPPGAVQQRTGLDETREVPGTTHLSVVDAQGNAVALTSSIEAGFGSGIMAAGFLLNNQLTDFSFRVRDGEGRQIANAPAPGKRPRSSMAPTMVFAPSGELSAVLGSPGGSRIPLYVIKSVIGLIDWKLDAQAAVDLPNFGSRNGPLELEADMPDKAAVQALRTLGHEITRSGMTSGTHLIVRRPNGMLEGGADPRREGIARGD